MNIRHNKQEERHMRDKQNQQGKGLNQEDIVRNIKKKVQRVVGKTIAKNKEKND